MIDYQAHTHPSKHVVQLAYRLTLVHRLRHWRNIKTTSVERVLCVCVLYPGKHEALAQCCFNVGPPSSTSAQH